LDEVRGDEEVNGMIDDLLASPVLRRVLCNPTNFSFNPRSLIRAKIDRVETWRIRRAGFGPLPHEPF
jgi:hypothetical protein